MPTDIAGVLDKMAEYRVSYWSPVMQCFMVWNGQTTFSLFDLEGNEFYAWQTSHQPPDAMEAREHMKEREIEFASRRRPWTPRTTRSCK